jgi:hypothetical protein
VLFNTPPCLRSASFRCSAASLDIAYSAAPPHRRSTHRRCRALFALPSLFLAARIMAKPLLLRSLLSEQFPRGAFISVHSLRAVWLSHSMPQPRLAPPPHGCAAPRLAVSQLSLRFKAFSTPCCASPFLLNARLHLRIAGDPLALPSRIAPLPCRSPSEHPLHLIASPSLSYSIPQPSLLSNTFATHPDGAPPLATAHHSVSRPVPACPGSASAHLS